VRRSLEEGGAPMGMVYVDSHQVAAAVGDVSSVSFYVDQTCASATVEFGAFDILDRNLEKNTAELVLKQRSGTLKIGAINDLKPYMNMITIRLCSGDAIDDSNSGGCQGHRFPVLPHQYIGVRSDTCRLGFAATPVNRVLATTWVSVRHVDETTFHEIINENVDSSNRQLARKMHWLCSVRYSREFWVDPIHSMNHMKDLAMYQLITRFYTR
jgi:hypothetical protein